MDLTFGVATTTTNAEATMDLTSSGLIKNSGWQSQYSLKYPNIAYGTQLSGFVAMQGALTMDIDIMGTKYSNINAYGTETRYGLSIGMQACGDRCTTVDTMVQGYNRVRGNVVGDIREGGRRQMTFPAAPPVDTPTTPAFCGGLQSGEVQLRDKWRVICGKSVEGSMSPRHSMTGIASFDLCLERCSTYTDCVAAGWFDARKSCSLYISVSGEGQNAAVNSVSVWAERLTTAPPAVPANETCGSDTRTLKYAAIYAHIPKPDFVKPAGVPSPLPASYPPRQPDKCFSTTTGGPYFWSPGGPQNNASSTFNKWDFQCGTTIDYTGAVLTKIKGHPNPFPWDTCMMSCWQAAGDCEAIVMNKEHECLLLTNKYRQRYSAPADEPTTLAILTDWGPYWDDYRNKDCKLPNPVV